MGLTIFQGIFSDIFHIYFECGKYMGIFHGILLVPRNIRMNLNNVMNGQQPK